ncbi:V8-like Glu-specific endopeptidase [Catalinimonas alkaloidigena]|uniref:trypsin-like serine protease n=1 Tax=Catalinimonas alkaloidigena TaxID=1075417 RepID=UPI002405D459|nr:trypsin-like serine protease [Catalinimonas alkaloidigena]MDF9800256.1 V8-like Glu-specific endopeptidase [Catalinimonas alkaloidigena]
MQYLISGKVSEKESGLPVVGIYVRAYDKDLIYDDLLGSSITDKEGKFAMQYEDKDFKEIFEGDAPEVYLNLLSGPRSLIGKYTLEALKAKKGDDGYTQIEFVIPREKLGALAPVSPEGFPALNEDVTQRKAIEAKTGLPGGVKIELDRIWQNGQNQADIERLENGNIVITKNFDLQSVQPPSIAFDGLNKDKLGDNVQDEIQGFIPGHLGIKFAPQEIRRIGFDTKDGEDRPVNVFPPDTRYEFNDTSFPWCTTGRVETPAGVCSGTMIGRNLMLTASHCIDWQDDSVGWIKFTPSYYNGSAPFGIAWGTRVVYWNKALGGLSDFETAFDYVVVVLDRNMGDLTGYTGYRKYSSSWNNGNYWQVIGYPASLTGTQRPTFSGGGSIWNTASFSTSGKEGLVMGTFIDITPGNSGGPVWGWWGDEPWPRVVGVVSAESSSPGFSTSGDNEAGGGEALSVLITYSRDNYS